MYTHNSGGKQPVVYMCGQYNDDSCDCMGVKIDWIENSFRILLNKGDDIKAILNESTNVSPLKLDTLKGQLNDIQKKITRLTNLITNDDQPSDSLVNNLKALERDERTKQREIDIEEAVIRSATPTANILRDYTNKALKDKWKDPIARLQIREIIRQIVERVVVDRAKKSYIVYFKNSTKPVRVKLLKDRCIFNDDLEEMYDQPA